MFATLIRTFTPSAPDLPAEDVFTKYKITGKIDGTMLGYV